MPRSVDHRSFGRDLTGTRPVLRPGDPGIDEAWLRRYRLSAIFATVWCVLLPVLLSIGFLSAWGPFGLIDAWQLEMFGSGNVILLVILFLPLAFAPLIAACLLPIDASKPVLLGIRQSFDASWGPQVAFGAGGRRGRLRLWARAAMGVAILGAAALAFFAWKGVRDGHAPHVALVEMRYDRLVHGRSPLPRAVRVSGAVADRSTAWNHRYSVRRDVHQDVYYALRPANGTGAGPAALVELDRTSPQYETAPWNMIDPPGAREGIPSLLDDWTAARLRHAGIRLAPRAILLERRQLGGREPGEDPVADYAFAIFGFVAMMFGLLFRWRLTRLADRVA